MTSSAQAAYAASTRGGEFDFKALLLHLAGLFKACARVDDACMFSRPLQSTDKTEDLRVAFSVFDKDKSGTISAAELRSLMANYGVSQLRHTTRLTRDVVAGQQLTKKDAEEIIAFVDKDGDGEVCMHASLL